MLQTPSLFGFSKDSVRFLHCIVFDFTILLSLWHYFLSPGLLKRSPMVTSSDLVKNILKNNETRRLKSYIESGCINMDDAAKSTKACKLLINYFDLILKVCQFMWNFHFFINILQQYFVSAYAFLLFLCSPKTTAIRSAYIPVRTFWPSDQR